MIGFARMHVQGLAAHEIIHHLEMGELVYRTLETAFNLAATAILDAGIRSAASDKLELVDDARWYTRSGRAQARHPSVGASTRSAA